MGKTITPTYFKVITTDKICGFKGNVTYERYTGVRPPIVYNKGNDYDYVWIGKLWGSFNDNNDFTFNFNIFFFIQLVFNW